MSDINFYHKGAMIFDKKLKDKILKDATLCMWHDSDYMIDESFTGYKKDNKYYDICSLLYSKSVKKFIEDDKEYDKKFYSVKKKLLETISIIDDFIESLEEITKTKNSYKNLKKRIEIGYEHINTNIGRGKKSRRFKKDNRRFFTEREIIDFKQDLENLASKEISLSKKIKLEEVIRNVFKSIEGITIDLMYKYNNRFEWHETVALFKDYEYSFERLKDKVNLFTYSNMKDHFIKINKEMEKNLEDITLFEETVEKVENEIKEEKEYYESTQVKEKRQVTKKAKFYIDENGNRVKLMDNVEQLVLHN